jgi:hypothetical protein
VSALERIVQGRPLAGRDVAASSVSGGDWRSCHVLFLTGLDAARSQRIVDELKGAPVLTVSDRERFAEAGGIVGLVVDAGKIRFKINTDAAERARLHLSSRDSSSRRSSRTRQATEYPRLCREGATARRRRGSH